jgi:hypothetical protein
MPFITTFPKITQWPDGVRSGSRGGLHPPKRDREKERERERKRERNTHIYIYIERERET